MKLKNIITIGLFLVGIFMISSCRTNTIVSEEYAFMTFETECLGIELDGSQTLRAWGKGKDIGMRV